MNRDVKCAEYEIRTVADFAKVPADRLPQCLSEFQRWVRLIRERAAVEEMFKKMAGEPAALGTDRFIWRDDGNPGLSGVQIVDKESGETVFRVDLR